MNRLVVDDDGRSADDRHERSILKDLMDLQAFTLLLRRSRLRLEQEDACRCGGEEEILLSAMVTLTGENWEIEHTLEEAERGEGLQCRMIRKET